MKLSDLFEVITPPKIVLSPAQQQRDDVAKAVDFYFNVSGKYSINDDLTVDVVGSVGLLKKLDKLPIKFGKVSKSFLCHDNNLTTLEGSPYQARGFYCHNNKLTSLIGGPKVILNGGKNTYGEYWCGGNNLTTLEGSPNRVEAFACNTNSLTSLDDLPSDMNSISLTYQSDLPLLKLLFVKNLNEIQFLTNEGQTQNQYDTVKNILSNYLRQGRKGAIQCAAELTKAGYKRNARL